MKEQPIEIWYDRKITPVSTTGDWHGVSEGTARVAAEYMNNGKRPLTTHIKTVILMFQAGF